MANSLLNCSSSTDLTKVPMLYPELVACLKWILHSLEKTNIIIEVVVQLIEQNWNLILFRAGAPPLTEAARH